ncbi:MAG: hypothetical protein AAGC65_04740 [Mucilaginibacter sp.]|uniref:hypothetical protein n=1 Tax=Mucilaginibacter sp. TaxID=1882438 RepID=UPI0031B0BF18
METTTETQTTKRLITGNEGGPIDLEQAASWTANHRHRHPKNDTVSQFFGQAILNRILQQEGCMGIRIYYANSHKLSSWQKFLVSIGNFFIKTLAHAEGQQRFIITGVIETGEDILPEPAPKTNIKDASAALKAVAPNHKLMLSIVGDQSHPCPGSEGCPKNVLTK